MVMETPSPQCVGREFVRQYYTVLNQAPLQLHRFYSNNSSFVHGGLDKPGQESKPVVGQHEIHQRIMQLNFRDCHAKICQVDSHETLEGGVVVQVIGELSNNGQPMRRFMQTFVLAPQSPKQFYVRNDIFRYQDEIFTDDDETETQEIEETELDDKNDSGAGDEIQDINTSCYCDDVVRNGTTHEIEPLTTTAPPSTQSIPQELSPRSETDWDTGDADTLKNKSESFTDWDNDVESLKGKVDIRSEWEPAEDSSPEEEKVINTSKPKDVIPTSQNEPKTYANMVSKNAQSGGFSNITQSGPNSVAVSIHSSSHIKTESASSITKAEHVFISGSTSISGSSAPGQSSQLQRPTRSIRTLSMRSSGPLDGCDSSTQSNRIEDGSGDLDRRKPIGSMYPDSHQLFVGNLPHKISEEELKEHFMQYGNVVELRINSKVNCKPGSGTKAPPNYGFVVFEDYESAQRVLNDRPISYHNHRLNVEEKKTKLRDPRPGGGDGRINSGGRGGMMGRGGMGGGRSRGGIGGMQGSGRGDSRGGRGGRR